MLKGYSWGDVWKGNCLSKGWYIDFCVSGYHDMTADVFLRGDSGLGYMGWRVWHGVTFYLDGNGGGRRKDKQREMKDTGEKQTYFRIFPWVGPLYDEESSILRFRLEVLNY